MSDKAEACRRKAAECERAAVLANEDSVRCAYLDLARQWREMADHAEHIERLRTLSKANFGRDRQRAFSLDSAYP